MPPSVRSVNVALPTKIRSGREVIRTGIFKKPVIGRVGVRTLNLDGDQQADLKVHGGPDKAVYVYPLEHYEFWERELGRAFPEWGTFGENLTTQGIFEDGISVGDEGNGSTLCVPYGAEFPRALNERSKDRVGENAKDIGNQTRVVAQTVTGSMRKRQHPLPHRNSREHVMSVPPGTVISM